MPSPRPARSVTGHRVRRGLQRGGPLQRLDLQPASEPEPVAWPRSSARSRAGRSAGPAGSPAGPPRTRRGTGRRRPRTGWSRRRCAWHPRQQQRVLAGLGQCLLAPLRHGRVAALPGRDRRAAGAAPPPGAARAACRRAPRPAASGPAPGHPAGRGTRPRRRSAAARRAARPAGSGSSASCASSAAASRLPRRRACRAASSRAAATSRRRLGRPSAACRARSSGSVTDAASRWCSARRAVGGQVLVRDRRDQRVREPDPFTVDLEDACRDGLLQAASRRGRRPPTAAATAATVGWARAPVSSSSSRVCALRPCSRSVTRSRKSAGHRQRVGRRTARCRGAGGPEPSPGTSSGSRRWRGAAA